MMGSRASSDMDMNGSRTAARCARRTHALAEPLLFLRGWWRNPVAVGGPFASSPWTARRLAQAVFDVAVPRGGPILELGAGTGTVTEAIIDGGCPIDQVVVVERDPELCRSLKKRFCGMHVLHGNALELGTLLARSGISSVCVVLSGLPMRAVAPEAAARCYSEAFQHMPASGAVIQYTYGFRPPVDPENNARKLAATFVGREWRNVPPMGIWSYRQALAAHRQQAITK
jgi:phosphatidylethanolamine/phosphatidyl-N-methylethanolamine N-methyltransferase